MQKQFVQFTTPCFYGVSVTVSECVKAELKRSVTAYMLSDYFSGLRDKNIHQRIFKGT